MHQIDIERIESDINALAQFGFNEADRGIYLFFVSTNGTDLRL